MIKNRKDEGFTLVELLIVIVILGILATIVVFAVRGITDQGQENACKATAKTYEVAIEAYRAQELTYPSTIGELDSYWRNPPKLYTVSGSNNIVVSTDGGTAGCLLTYP